MLDGSKVTLNVLLWFGASINGVEMPPSPNPAPPVLTEVTETFWPPGFEIVRDCELIWPIVTVPKEMLVGLSTNCPAVTPVPLSATTCGLCGTLSANDKVPARVPATVGLNVTFTVQLAAAVKVVPQLLVCAKSPVTLTLAMERFALPVLLSVMLPGALVEFRTWLLNVKFAGVTVAAAVGTLAPVPDNATG
jgi:hypothetical protein